MYLDWKKREYDALAGGMEGEIREECEVELTDNDGVVEMQHGLGEDGNEAISHTPQTQAQSLSTTMYHLPSSHPRHLQRIPAGKIISNLHATSFLAALTSLFCRQGFLYVPHTIDTFDMYSCLVFRLPSIPEVSAGKEKNIIRACLPISHGPRHSTEPAHLDFMLIRMSEKNPSTDGTGLEGWLFTSELVI